MKPLLLTRPEEDSIALRDALRRLHIESLIAPMMEIVNLPGPTISTEKLQGFLVTSANGVRALAERTDNRDLPVFAVGDATARAATYIGFGTVNSAAGDVDDLAALVRHECDPENGGFFHAAGTVTAGDLSGQLSEAGFEVVREKIYEAKPVDTLPYDAAIALKTRSVQGVVLFSPRTAEIFVDRVNEAGLMMLLPHVQLIALSKNVRDAAGNAWSGVIIARQPTQESLLNAVRTCYY